MSFRLASVPFRSLWSSSLVGMALTLAPTVLADEPKREPQNGEMPAMTGDDLTERARHLFDAIVRDDPELADDFFFPREPFLVLKDVADPAKYHAQLLATYRRDVHRLHGKRRTWDGATFRSFELGTTPRWVKPGDEWNKIGYHRTFRGKLRYEVSGHVRTLEVHTIISWDGRWYVTHLEAIRH
jgi:hypothetical protein